MSFLGPIKNMATSSCGNTASSNLRILPTSLVSNSSTTLSTGLSVKTPSSTSNRFFPSQNSINDEVENMEVDYQHYIDNSLATDIEMIDIKDKTPTTLHTATTAPQMTTDAVLPLNANQSTTVIDSTLPSKASPAEKIFQLISDNQITIRSFAKFLKKNPQHINAQNSDGDTFLHLYIKMHQPDVAQILIELNVDLNIKNNDGLTPLILTAKLGGISILNCLLKRQALNINESDNAGNTALHHAVISKRKMVIARLLKHDQIDRNMINNNGKAPCDLASSKEISSLFA